MTKQLLVFAKASALASLLWTVGCATPLPLSPDHAPRENTAFSGASEQSAGESSRQSSEESSRQSSESSSEQTTEGSSNSGTPTGPQGGEPTEQRATAVVRLAVLVKRSGDAPGDLFAHVQGYLGANRRAILNDISGGSGGFVNELGAALELPSHELARLGRALQRGYDELAGYLPGGAPTVDRHNTAQFASRLLDYVTIDPTLRGFVDRVSQRY